MKKWLNVPEVAEHIGISKHTVYSWVDQRKIPFTKVPGSNRLLFDREKLDALLESCSFKTITQALKGGDP